MVSLHSEEQIVEECRKKTNITNNIESHSYQKEFVLFIKNTSFTLQVPVVGTPTFTSDIGTYDFDTTCHYAFII